MMPVHRSGCGCGCDGRRGWPSNAARVRVLVAGVQPLVRGVIGALDVALSNGLAGRSGRIRIGEASDPAFGYRGYVAYQRTAALPYPAAATLRRSPNTALPSTSGDVSYGLSPAGQAVMEHLRRLTPNGMR